MVFTYSLVSKKNRSLLLCIDFRNLNSLPVSDVYPLPRINETLDKLGGAEWFSTLDLASGYCQIPVCQSDISKTAFTALFGLYEFVVIPFGLNNTPAIYHRTMDNVFDFVQSSNILVYIDGIVIFSSSKDSHFQDIEKVFNQIRECNLKLQPSKCQFFLNKIKYSGFLVGKSGLKIYP